ncbi:sulfite exporter TauE/SafE family protein [Candidatus Nitrospira salsa]
MMEISSVVMVACGVVVGLGAAFTGLGGGFLMVPLLLFFGFTAQKAIGTSFLGILLIAISALLAQNKLAHVDYKVGLLLGVGGIVGAQIGTHLLEHVSTDQFKKIFAMILVMLGVYLFVKD